MREGVERSAKSVLGDETAALRRARASSKISPIRSIKKSPRRPARNRHDEGGTASKLERPDSQGPKDGQQAADPFDEIEMIGRPGQPGDQEQQKQQGQKGAGREQPPRARTAASTATAQGST